MLTCIYVAIVLVSVIALPPLLDGVRRKVYAYIQRRIGPPITQTWYDIFKLYRRSASAAETGNPLYLSAPAASLAYAVIASLMVAVPLLDQVLAGVLGFTILLAGSVAVIAVATAGLTPLTSAGSVRMMFVSAIAEAGVFLGLIASSPTLFLHDLAAPLQARLAAAAALTLAAVVELELAPYNIVEAGPEIAAGPYTEYGGAELALLLQSAWCRGFTLLLLAGLLVSGSWPAAVVYMAAAYLVAAFITAAIGRPRPLRAMGLAFTSLIAGIVALLLAV